jgi:hypothetical protein
MTGATTFRRDDIPAIQNCGGMDRRCPPSPGYLEKPPSVFHMIFDSADDRGCASEGAAFRAFGDEIDRECPLATEGRRR